jgi:hypothetical protein
MTILGGRHHKGIRWKNVRTLPPRCSRSSRKSKSRILPGLPCASCRLFVPCNEKECVSLVATSLWHALYLQQQFILFHHFPLPYRNNLPRYQNVQLDYDLIAGRCWCENLKGRTWPNWVLSLLYDEKRKNFVNSASGDTDIRWHTCFMPSKMVEKLLAWSPRIFLDNYRHSILSTKRTNVQPNSITNIFLQYSRTSKSHANVLTNCKIVFTRHCSCMIFTDTYSLLCLHRAWNWQGNWICTIFVGTVSQLIFHERIDWSDILKSSSWQILEIFSFSFKSYHCIGYDFMCISHDTNVGIVKQMRGRWKDVSTAEFAHWTLFLQTRG